MSKFEIKNGIPVFETPTDKSNWFGYYNYSPIDSTGEKLLAHRADFDGRMVTAEDWVEVGWYDLHSGEWHSLGTTNTVNWQQGAMLQWRPGHQNEVIYNCLVNGKFGSRIVNVETGEERYLSWPIYALTPDGKYSLTLNFERLYWTRAYHYDTIKNEKYNVNVAEDDGIFLLDLQNNTVKRIISIKDIIHTDYESEFADRSHWVEHIMLNREGTRFAFYHRFTKPSGFNTRLLTANIDGSEIYNFKEWQDIAWSHLGWKTEQEFVAFGYERVKSAKVYDTVTKKTGIFGDVLRQIYRKLVYPILPRKIHHSIAVKSCYEEYVDKQNKQKRYNHSLMYNDGHPGFTRDGRFMLSDTYALEDGYRYLYIYDTEKDLIHEIGKFYSPFNNCGYRSDLHPRFSNDEKYVIIDSAHSGRHGMVVLEINLECWGDKKDVKKEN